MEINSFVALITAFRQDETVNFDKIKKEVVRQSNAGNDIFACGTNGDFTSLTFNEKVEVIRSCAEVTKEKKCRLIANAGCPSTYETVLLAKEFAKVGVDGIAAVVPYFIVCTQDGLYQHYLRIADESSVPVYIYEIPARTGNSVAIETVEKLATHPNIKGIKDSGGNIERLNKLSEIAKAHDQFEFYVGTDSLILYGLERGAKGCVSGLANVIPLWIQKLICAFKSSNLRAASEMQNKINSFRNDLYMLGYGPALVKRILYLIDPEVGNNRMPALYEDAEIDKALQKLINKYVLDVENHVDNKNQEESI